MKNYIHLEDGTSIPISKETVDNIINSNKELTFQDIMKVHLFKKVFVLNSDNDIRQYEFLTDYIGKQNENCVATEQRAKQLQAIIKMMICADYFNEKSEVYPDGKKRGYFFEIDVYNNLIVNSYIHTYSSFIYFENAKDARETIRILGEDTIRLALTGH